MPLTTWTTYQLEPPSHHNAVVRGGAWLLGGVMPSGVAFVARKTSVERQGIFRHTATSQRSDGALFIAM